MNHTITLSDDKIIFMDDETGNIIVSAEDMPKEVACGDTVLIQFEEDSSNIQHKYTVSEYDVENSIFTLDWVTKVEQDMLTEAPIIKFDDADINNPDSIDLKNIVARETEKEQRAEAEKAEAAKQAEFREKYASVYEELKTRVNEHENTIDILEYLFENMVPSSGVAETTAGEYVRAMMRILYRDYNDGDKFFTGYGIETCGSSAEWLHDNGLLEEVESIVEDAYRLEDDDEYTAAITDLAQSVLIYLVNHEELFYKANDEDSRDYTTEYIEENQPRYEFECYASDAVVDLVEKGVLTAWDLNSYVEEQLSYESYYNNAKVERPWTSHDTTVIVTDLTKDGYDALRDTFNRDVDSFWRTLVEDNIDDLDDDYDEDDE